ncbi:unnamed protein product, partial [Mesorhabditis spiculigera]
MTVEATESAVPHLVLTEDIKDLSRLLDETKEVRLEADKLLDPLPEMPMGGGLPLALHHDIYATIKHEIPSTADDDVKNIPGVPGGSEQQMLFGVNNFALNVPYCAPGGTNNNNEIVNHNHSKNGRILTADRKRPYPCSRCTSRFGSKMELEEHQNSHTGQKPFECDVCKARFNRRSTLWNHKRIHSDAKPFVCTVCQMTFKWKNSLKCHKEMHLRKNESSTVLDNDLRQLTYATAAKKRLIQMVEEGQLDGSGSAVSSAIHSQPLITTASPKKKNGKNQHSTSGGLINIQTSLSSASKGWMNTNMLSQNDHPLDLDPSSLDTLVQQSNQNLLAHLCSTDMDNCRNTNILGSMDDTNAMLSNPLFSDMKPDLNLLHHHQDIQFQYPNNLLSSSMSAHSPLNVQLPLNLMNINRINGLHSPQQLPSVHHLSSTSLANGVVLPMEYPLHDSIVSSVGHPQYIVTPPSDIMLSHSALAYPSQGLMDNGCNPLPGCSEYAPNFDYGSGLMGGQYQLSDDQMSLAPQQQDSILNDETKCLPYDQW